MRTPKNALFALPALALLAACSGSGAQQPPPATEPAAQTQPAPAAVRDPTLSDAPVDAAVVVLVDGRALRASPLYTHVRQLVGNLPALSPCGGDPLATVDRLTYAVAQSGHVDVALRGPIAEPANDGCARALLSAFYAPGVEPVRAGGAVFADAGPGNEPLRAALEGGPSAAANPVLAALHADVPGEGVTYLVDFDAWRPQLGGVHEPPPGMDLATAERLLGSFHGGGAVLTAPADGSIAVTLHGVFDNPDDASAFNDWVAGRFTALAGELRDRLQQPLPDAETEHYRPALLATLDRLINGTHFATRGAAVHATAALDGESVQTLASAAPPALTAYSRAAKTAEARSNLALLAHAAVAYGAEHAASRPVPTPPRRGRRGASIPPPPPSPFPPSAPRTPADVPRGSRVVDPAGTWDTPTWRALSFSIDDPHYYAYEFVNQGNAFTARAYGDLDGDGVLSTFEISGHIEPDGRVVLDGDVRATNELE